MPDPFIIAVITITFLLAGAVKGVTGLGLPTISLGLLTVALDLPTAMALVIVPSLLTNLYQASVGGHARLILRRIWPFLLVAAATVWIGATALTRVDLNLLSALLGALLIGYAGMSLAGKRLVVPAHSERWAAPVLGATNGVLTGMTGTFVIPSVMYFQAIGLPRDVMVQAMGIMFTTLTIALALALSTHDLLPEQLGLASALSVLPALAGMLGGQALRHKLPEERFRRILFAAILVLGSYILIRSLI